MKNETSKWRRVETSGLQEWRCEFGGSYVNVVPLEEARRPKHATLAARCASGSSRVRPAKITPGALASSLEAKGAARVRAPLTAFCAASSGNLRTAAAPTNRRKGLSPSGK